jgi:hypothetical protein
MGTVADHGVSFAQKLLVLQTIKWQRRWLLLPRWNVKWTWVSSSVAGGVGQFGSVLWLAVCAKTKLVVRLATQAG